MWNNYDTDKIREAKEFAWALALGLGIGVVTIICCTIVHHFGAAVYSYLMGV